SAVLDVKPCTSTTVRASGSPHEYVARPTPSPTSMNCGCGRFFRAESRSTTPPSCSSPGWVRRAHEPRTGVDLPNRSPFRRRRVSVQLWVVVRRWGVGVLALGLAGVADRPGSIRRLTGDRSRGPAQHRQRLGDLVALARLALLGLVLDEDHL